jgi:hypothetical protein
MTHLIFAAGPTGLYAFDSGGASIGRMIFDEPVSGVSVSRDFLYLSVGHLLCRVPLAKLHENMTEIKAWISLRVPTESKLATSPSSRVSPPIVRGPPLEKAAHSPTGSEGGPTETEPKGPSPRGGPTRTQPVSPPSRTAKCVKRRRRPSTPTVCCCPVACRKRAP